MRILILALALFFAPLSAPALAATHPVETAYDSGDVDGAVALAREGAAAGDAVSAEWLGRFYEDGVGVVQDYAQAAVYFRSAAESGRNLARWRVGVLIDEGKIEGTLQDAVALFQAGADDGYLDCIVSLAVMQATGRGTPVDYEASMTNYMRAAQAGSEHGIQGVGILHALGQGVPRDMVEAMAWFSVAGFQGSEPGRANAARVLESLDDAQMKTAAARAEAIMDELGIE
ncbi:MAG: tetratricopeptide repeat protein [Pseudomonadota bacterium]